MNLSLGNAPSKRIAAPAAPSKRIAIDKAEFVFIRGKQLDRIRRRYAKGGIRRLDIQKLDRLEYARLTGEQAAALQQEGWIRKGHVDIRTYPFKYTKPGFSYLMQFWRGIKPEDAQKLDRKSRVHFFAHKLGWHRDQGPANRCRYHMYKHALRYATEHGHVEQETLDTDDDVLYRFLREFRKIKLGFEQCKKSFKQCNFFPLSFVVPLCVEKGEVVLCSRRSHDRATDLLLQVSQAYDAGTALLEQFEQRERDIVNWQLLFGKHFQPAAVRAHVARCLFLKNMPKSRRVRAPKTTTQKKKAKREKGKIGTPSSTTPS